MTANKCTGCHISCDHVAAADFRLFEKAAGGIDSVWLLRFSQSIRNADLSASSSASQSKSVTYSNATLRMRSCCVEMRRRISVRAGACRILAEMQGSPEPDLFKMVNAFVLLSRLCGTTAARCPPQHSASPIPAIICSGSRVKDPDPAVRAEYSDFMGLTWPYPFHRRFSMRTGRQAFMHSV